MGASDRDMQRGTILVFEMNILNLKGSLGKGTKREENPYLISRLSTLKLAAQRTPPNTRPNPRASTPT